MRCGCLLLQRTDSLSSGLPPDTPWCCPFWDNPFCGCAQTLQHPRAGSFNVAHQKPLMPGSTSRPAALRHAELRPPGLGAASKMTTSTPASCIAYAAPRPPQPPPITTARGLPLVLEARATTACARFCAGRCRCVLVVCRSMVPIGCALKARFAHAAQATSATLPKVLRGARKVHHAGLLQGLVTGVPTG